jgi:hypothetical protein
VGADTHDMTIYTSYQEAPLMAVAIKVADSTYEDVYSIYRYISGLTFSM